MFSCLDAPYRAFPFNLIFRKKHAGELAPMRFRRLPGVTGPCPSTTLDKSFIHFEHNCSKQCAICQQKNEKQDRRALPHHPARGVPPLDPVMQEHSLLRGKNKILGQKNAACNPEGSALNLPKTAGLCPTPCQGNTSLGTRLRRSKERSCGGKA